MVSSMVVEAKHDASEAERVGGCVLRLGTLIKSAGSGSLIRLELAMAIRRPHHGDCRRAGRPVRPMR